MCNSIHGSVHFWKNSHYACPTTEFLLGIHFSHIIRSQCYVIHTVYCMLLTFSFSIVNSQLLSGANAEQQPSAYKNHQLFRMRRSLAVSPSWHLTLSFVMRLHHHVAFHCHLPSFNDILVQIAQDDDGPILCVLSLPYFRVCLPETVIMSEKQTYMHV